MPYVFAAGRFAVFLAILVAPARACAADPAPRSLLLTGRYAEAATGYAQLAQQDPLAGALGQAECQLAQGKLEAARKTLTSLTEEYSDAAAPRARLAELELATGNRQAAERWAAAARKLEENNLAARWVQAELLRTAGDLKAADAAYGWFVEHYNATDRFTNPDDLRYIGLAAAQFARWNRLSDQFAFLVNELYPSALELDANYWPAHLESGRLFLEKYNQAEATRSLAAAAKINPNSADVQAALAELAIQNFDFDAADRAIRHALAIHPAHATARRMQADRHLANFEPAAARDVLEALQKDIPNSEATLGRLAGCYALLDGTQPADNQPLAKLINEVEERNPHCGEFYAALADSLDRCRKFPDAARYYARAIEVHPRMVGPRGQLGLMHMRLGEEDQARKVLDESFEIDPFNVRVSNSLKVLEVLDGYATLETEHFILRYDQAKDEVLARYAARYLEQIYPELCRRLDFTPPDKSLFEIFNKARNTDGHGWFSARMVGLPQIHTIGACAGKMVALTSPTSMKQRFNWARVLRHEFVHVINLQQTNFNIPHWFTEALAVLIEDSPRPADWETMLARRVPAGEVFTLDTINLGFIRPHSSEDWQMAYCQAEIYAEFMLDKFGDDALAKMLSAYADNLATPQAIERSFGMTQKEFDAEYSAYLNKLVAGLNVTSSGKAELDFAELQRQVAATPEDSDLTAQLAVAHLDRKNTATAGKLAERVLAKKPDHPLATYVKAKLLLSIGQQEPAVAMLQAALNAEQPEPRIVKLLAGLKYRDKDYQGAAALYELAAQHRPQDLAWTRSLAMVYLRLNDEEKLTAALTRLATADADNLVIRRKLASLAASADNQQQAARWAREVVEIDVMDAAMHRQLGESLMATDRPAEAVAAYEAVVLLSPADADALVALAKAQQAAGQPDAARVTLDKLLKRSPDHAPAKQLLESLPQ